METTLTYRFRIKDSRTRDMLLQMKYEVNLVWNFCNETMRKRWKESRLPTDMNLLHALTKGSSQELNLHSQTIQATYEELLNKSKQFKKFIRWRSLKRHLGWIPLKASAIKFNGDYITYCKNKYRFWDHRKLPEGSRILCGSFCEDTQGRWYLNLVVKFPEYLAKGLKEVTAIDLGLKTVAVLADGTEYKRDNLTKKYQDKLAAAQRHRKKRQVKNLHAKIKNARSDFNHKVSHDIAKNYQTVFCGDVSSSKLSQTKFAKSVYDASWYQLKTLLSYKVLRRQGVYKEIRENNSTVLCSTCGSKSGPSGVKELGVREWTCSACKEVHNRDVNAAKNILRFGHETLSGTLKNRLYEGIPALKGGEDVTLTD